MKRTHQIVATYEGPLSAIVDQSAIRADQTAHPVPALDDVLSTLRELAFVAETVGHLQPGAGHVLHTAERARALVAALEPRTITEG